jgi:hypothetical protein
MLGEEKVTDLQYSHEMTAITRSPSSEGTVMLAVLDLASFPSKVPVGFSVEGDHASGCNSF